MYRVGENITFHRRRLHYAVVATVKPSNRGNFMMDLEIEH